MIFGRNKGSELSKVEYRMKEANSVIIYWSGFPYESSILFMSKKIEGISYTVDDYVNHPEYLSKIRSEYDRDQLTEKLNIIKKEKDENPCAFDLTFCVQTNISEEVWIKESTRIFKESEKSIFSETVYTNVTKEMNAAFFIKEAASDSLNDSVNAYNIKSLKRDENYEIAVQSLKNIDMFIELQSIILNGKMVFGCFYDTAGNKFSDFKGSLHAIDYCNNIMGADAIDKMSADAFEKAVREGQDAIIADERFAIKCISMPIYYKDKLFGTWNVIFSEKYTENEEEFVGGLEVIKGRMSKYLEIYFDSVVDKKRKKDLENNLVEEINRNDVFHYIINLLETDEDISSVARGVLVEMGNAMHLSNTFIIGIPKRANLKLEIVGEWRKDEEISYIDQYIEFLEGKLSDPHFKNSEFGDFVIVTKDDEEGPFKEFIDSVGATAMVCVPIFVNNLEVSMFAVFIDNKSGRVWDLSDISFISNVCSVLENILFKRYSEKKLQSSYAALKEILDNMGCMVYVSDMDTDKILFCNSEVRDTLQTDITNMYCKDIEKIAAFMAGESEIRDKSTGSWYEIKKTEITWIDGNEVNLWVVSDITRKKNYEEKIERQAKFDSLTGLSNRISGERELAKIVEECKFDKGKSAALLFIDLDNFKDINDGLGHDYGDDLLRLVSQGMNQINGIGGRCFRFGGDEFIVIVNPEYFGELERIIEELQTLFNKPWSLDNRGDRGSEGVYEYYCTMSMGVVKINHETESANDVIKNADIAMYEAKKNGKNNYRLFNSLEPNEISMRLDMEKTMRNAVSNKKDEFKVYFQPIIDSETGEISACESLVRWDSSEKGFIMPNDFIEIAEHIGTIYDIGAHILEQACIINKQWEMDGHRIITNVNVSMMQIMQNDVVDVISGILEKTNVNRDNIIIEITENIAASDIEKTAKIISRIRDLGVRIALDDFGTGYSSLSYIKMLKPDVIKVDRVFTNDINTDPYSKTFIKMIIEIAKVLDVKICVEGVETKEQYYALKEMGASNMQGFLFGKAVNPEMFKNKFLGETIDIERIS